MHVCCVIVINYDDNDDDQSIKAKYSKMTQKQLSGVCARISVGGN